MNKKKNLIFQLLALGLFVLLAQTTLSALTLIPIPAKGGVDVTEGGVASDDGAINPEGQDEAKAFDNTKNTKWLVSSPTGIIQYEFAGTTAYAVNIYTVASAEDVPTRDPKNWLFQGSDDGINWTTLDKRDDITFANRKERQVFPFTNTTAYRRYRLKVTANHGAPLLQISEIQMCTDGMAPTPEPVPPPRQFVSCIMGSPNTEDGLKMVTKPGGKSEPGTIDGVSARRANANYSIFFKVDKNYINVPDNNVEITVKARQVTSGAGINLYYESVNGDANTGKAWIPPGSDKWYTHTFIINAARFADRSDWNFRIDVKDSPSDVWIQRVEAKRIDNGPPPPPRRNMVNVTSPAYNSTVKGNTTININAPGLTTITSVKCWESGSEYGSDRTFVSNLSLNNGLGSFVFPADKYPHGPIVIRITGTNGADTDTCYLMLYNAGGVSWNEGLPAQPAAAAGMSLVFADDFTKMPTISRGGIGATYNSIKAGGDEYGDGICVTPADPYDVYLQRDTYLRIRASYQPNIIDPCSWNRKYATGMLTSERTDGTGVTAFMGYFECKMMAQCAIGSWPAFWFLTQGTNGANPMGDEYDTIEGYGSWKVQDGYRVGKHEWGYGSDNKGAKITTTSIGGGGCPFDGFHTYGMKVTPTTVYWYYDNIQVWSSETTEVVKKEGLNFMINNELGGGWPVDLTRYGNKSDLWIDFVRVYQ